MRTALGKVFARDLLLAGVVVPFLYLSRRACGFRAGRIRSGAVEENRQGKEMRMRGKRGLWMVIAVGALLLASRVTCVAAWGGQEIETEKIAVTFAREVERGGYRVVTTGELKGWIDHKKEMLIVDTMPYEASYKKQHIPGAKQIELPIPEMVTLDGGTRAVLEKLLGPDKARVIVFYCGFVKCTRSHNGAMWAVKLGYRNVYRHPGGIKAWDEADYPIEKVK